MIGSGNAHRVESRTSRTGRGPIAAVSFVALLVGTAVGLHSGGLFAQSESDFRWTPPAAEELQEYADAVEGARAAGEGARTREAILQLARAILPGIPDGALAIADGRWLGPGPYLNEVLSLIGPNLRQRVRELTDLELGTHLVGPDGAILRSRLDRDFPTSTLAGDLRRERAERLLERGEVTAYLDLVDAPVAARRRAELEPLTTRQGLAAPRWQFGDPLRVVSRLHWALPTSADSPWRRTVVERRPLHTPDAMYIQGEGELRRLDAETGASSWAVPFFDPPGPRLPGSLAAPATLARDVLVTTGSRLVAIDAEEGRVHWDLRLAELFASAPLQAEERIVSASTPCACARGVLVAVIALGDDRVRGRLALVNREGALIWSRPLGGAPGATYLALGSSRPVVAVHGESVYVLTQRGLLLSVHVADGALQWATEYPSYGPRASRDALGQSDRFDTSDLRLVGRSIVGAPVDASGLLIWRRDGSLRAHLPRAGARWWAPLTDDPSRIALVTPRSLSIWKLVDGTPQHLESYTLPVACPDISGPPAFTSGQAWLPHATGYYGLDLAQGRWHFGHTTLDFRVESASPRAGGLLLAGAEGAAFLTPYPAELRTGDSFASRVYRTRSALDSASPDRLRAALEAVAAGAGSDAEAARERLSLVTDTVGRLGLLPGTQALPRELLSTLLDVAPTARDRGRLAYGQAVELFRHGAPRRARELASTALRRGDPDTLVTVGPLLVPLELAVRHLLAALDRSAPPSAAELEAVAERADRARTLALESGDPHELLKLARRYPGTAAGRRALLDLAESRFRRGAKALALATLERLITLEPESPEAVEARFEAASLNTEEKRYWAAREHLHALIDRYGALKLTTARGEERVAERASRRLARVPEETGVREPLTASGPLELHRSWRSRAELAHQRSLAVTDVGETHYLTVARRTISSVDAASGTPAWVLTLPGPPPLPAVSPIFTMEAAQLRAPIAIVDGAVLVSDRISIALIELADGAVRWTRMLDPFDTSGEVPPTEILPTETTPLAIAASDEVVVAAGSDEHLYCFEVRDGSRRWKRRLSGPLIGPPQIRDGRILLGYREPAKIELINVSTGRLSRSIFLQGGLDPGAEPPAVAPWYLADERVALPRTEELAAYDLVRSREAWRCPLRGTLRRVHDLPHLPFVVVESFDERAGPVLAGIDPATGDLLWHHAFGSRQRTIERIQRAGASLLVLVGAPSSRRLVRLDLPRIYLQEAARPRNLPVSELDAVWSRSLGHQWDEYDFSVHGDWILVRGEYNCSLTVVSLEKGTIVEGRPLDSLQRFLVGRRRLYHASFHGETLVVLTQRGGIGLRKLPAIERLRQQWHALAALDPLAPTPQSLAAAHRAAQIAFLDGRLDSACSILEDTLDQPGLPDRARRTLVSELEGVGQEWGETQPREWRAARMPRPPVIDGSLDEPWNAQTAVPLRAARYFHPMQGPDEDDTAWQGWRDLSAVLFTGWSDHGFHLALDVTDDAIHPYDRDAEEWVGDCLLIAFDFRGDGGLTARRDDQLYTLALTVPRPAAPGGAAGGDDDDDDDDDDSKPQGDFQVVRKGDGSGVIYEITVPWETFSSVREETRIPFSGLRFRLNVVLTDDDSGRGARTYLTLSPGQMFRQGRSGIWEIFAPEYFPRITLDN